MFPLGYYNPNKQAVNEEGCLPCDATFACNDTGMLHGLMKEVLHFHFLQPDLRP